MCGRFTRYYTRAEVQELMSVFGTPRNLSELQHRTYDDGRRDPPRQRRQARTRPDALGLIPAGWKKSAKETPATFNARAESVADKPIFRTAFRKQRCIIPASGFYEWTGEEGDRQPHLFTAADGSPILAFAVLWDHWRDRATGEEALSCMPSCASGSCTCLKATAASAMAAWSS